MEAHPEQEFVNEWPILKRFMFGETEISPKYREMIGLAVVTAIGCEYCRNFHRGAAQLHGATEAELAFLASYTPRYSAIIQAQDYNVDRFKDEVADIAAHLQETATGGA